MFLIFSSSITGDLNMQQLLQQELHVFMLSRHLRRAVQSMRWEELKMIVLEVINPGAVPNPAFGYPVIVSRDHAG